MPLMQFSMYACTLLVSWFGAKLIVGEALSTGQLMGLLSYAIWILMSLMMLSMVFVMIVISWSSAERITEILEEKSDLSNPKNPVREVKDGSVVFRNVSFSYAGKNGRPALSGIDLEIRSGETVGILGSTGAAKTTLVQLIPRLYDATEGAVLVGGVDVRDYDLTALRNQVAMVLQKNVLFSGTVKENLRWGNERATDEELVEAARLAQADGFIREFQNGYNTFIETGRRQCIRRTETASLYCPRPLKKTEDPDPGRFHQRRGYRGPTL